MLVDHVDPLSKLYCAVKPVTNGSDETNNAVPQVFVTAGVAGIAGNIPAFTTVGKVQGPTLPAGVLPHAALVTYLRSML